MNNCVSIILAAGKGTRMKSNLPKVLHPIGGKPMIHHVIAAAKTAGIKDNIVVVGHMSAAVMEEVGPTVHTVIQKEQKGTGHAVLMAEREVRDSNSTVIVLCGDAPLIKSETIKDLLTYHTESSADAIVLTAELDQPFGYGRIIRDEQGHLLKIVEEKDASDLEKDIREVNTGTYCFNAGKLFKALHEVGVNNAQGEYYLTDVLSIIRKEGGSIRVMKLDDPDEMLGVNTKQQLDRVAMLYNRKKETING